MNLAPRLYLKSPKTIYPNRLKLFQGHQYFRQRKTTVPPHKWCREICNNPSHRLHSQAFLFLIASWFHYCSLLAFHYLEIILISKFSSNLNRIQKFPSLIVVRFFQLLVYKHVWHGVWFSVNNRYQRHQIWTILFRRWTKPRNHLFFYCDEYHHLGARQMNCPHCHGWMVIHTCFNM